MSSPRVRIPSVEAAEAAISAEASRRMRRPEQSARNCSGASGRTQTQRDLRREVESSQFRRLERRLLGLEGSNAELRALVDALLVRIGII
jgi:hypothetical protein